MKTLAPALLLCLALLPAVPAAAAAAEVRILHPSSGQPLFGDVEIRADVRGAGVTRVEIYFDNVRVAVADRPPYRALVDAGHRNAEHSIEVVAYGAAGPLGSASLRTLPLQVDEEIEVGLQQLYVVAESGGRRVTDLARDDFTILDNGVPQEIVTFERGEIPFTAVLLVDASISMAGERLRTALDGARGFVAGMRRLDEAKLVLFSDHILLETPFTSVPSILSLGLSDVVPQGGTALNDALYLGLKRLDGRQGRRVLILLSDGVDIESVLPMEQVRRLARQRNTLLYWLRLRRPGEDDNPLLEIFSAWRDGTGHRNEKEMLRSAVLESGGRIEPLDGVEQIGPALEILLRELRDQYVLGYSPGNSKGRGTWHDVEIQVRRPGLQVRTQEGYLER